MTGGHYGTYAYLISPAAALTLLQHAYPAYAQVRGRRGPGVPIASSAGLSTGSLYSSTMDLCYLLALPPVR